MSASTELKIIQLHLQVLRGYPEIKSSPYQGA